MFYTLDQPPPPRHPEAETTPSMPKTRPRAVRIDPHLSRLIDAARNEATFSDWMRTAAGQRLEAEQGLGPEFARLLAEHTKQLRGLGTNLNQLARAANEGRPVVVNEAMLKQIQTLIRESRSTLIEVTRRLPAREG